MSILDFLIVFFGFLSFLFLKYQDGITLTILILKLMQLGLKILPQKEKQELHEAIDRIILRKKHKIPPDAVG